MTVLEDIDESGLINACVCQRPSWTRKTQPNGAVRRRLVEFLVFNSVYWKKSVPSNGRDRVHIFLRQMRHFLTDMSNRVEHQKLNQVTAELPPGWVFGVQLGLRQTQALINTYHIILIHHHRHVIIIYRSTGKCWPACLHHFPVNR